MIRIFRFDNLNDTSFNIFSPKDPHWSTKSTTLATFFSYPKNNHIYILLLRLAFFLMMQFQNYSFKAWAVRKVKVIQNLHGGQQ